MKRVRVIYFKWSGKYKYEGEYTTLVDGFEVGSEFRKRLFYGSEPLPGIVNSSWDGIILLEPFPEDWGEGPVPIMIGPWQ